MKKEVCVTHGGNLFDIEREFGIRKESIIDFSGNLNPLGPPASLRKALIDRMDLIGFYPDPDYVAVKEAIGEYTGLRPDRIILGNGSTELIAKSIRHISPRRAMTVKPTYSEYEKEISVLGGTVDFIDLDASLDFALDISMVKKAFEAGTHLFILCNPNNPTSTALSKDEIEEIVSMAGEHGAYVIVDETYVEFCDDMEAVTAAPLVDRYDNLFVLRGISKFFSTPGLRLGYGLTSNPAIREKIIRETDPWSINIFAGIAGEVVFRDREYISESRRVMREQKQYLFNELSGLSALKVYRPRANFILSRITDPSITMTGSELSAKLLGEHSILIRDTKHVEGLGDEYFRVCVLDEKANSLLISILGRLL